VTAELSVTGDIDATSTETFADKYCVINKEMSTKSSWLWAEKVTKRFRI